MSLATGRQWPGWGAYTDAARGSGEDPRGIEETVIWALFRNGLSPGIQGTHFRIRGPDELVGPQLVFLRVNSDCPVPWKNSNSSPIYPLSPQQATSGKGAIPSSGVNALMSPDFTMSYLGSFFFSFGSRCGIVVIK